MTIVLNRKSLVKGLGVVVLVGALLVQGFVVYRQHQWLNEEVGKLENGTVVTRAMLVDALIQKNFTKPSPPPEAPPGEVK